MNPLAIADLPYFTFDDSDDDSCLANVSMSDIDRYIFLIGGSITALTTLFLLIGSIRFKELRKQPGDLIIGIAASDFILSIHWITLAIWRDKINEHGFCTIVGTFGTLAGINEFLYNSAFSIYLISILRNALKQAKIPQIRFHIFNFLFSLVDIIHLLSKQEIGKTLAGTCSLKSKCHLSFLSYFGPCLALCYCFLGIFTYFYIKKNTPKCAHAHNKRTQFLNYYLKYNIVCTIIYFAIALCNFLVTFLTYKNIDKDIPKYEWINSVFNVTKLCSPLVLSFIRFNDPTIKTYWLRTIFFWRKISTAPNQEPLIEGEADKHEHAQSVNKDFVFNELSLKRRIELVYTILSCALYANQLPMTRRRSSITAQTSDKESKNPYKHRKVFLIEDENIKNDLPDVKQELEERGFNILPGSLKVYSPEVYNQIVNQDRDYLDIADSLDFKFNKEQIEDASGPGGGKSGEFFFFSRDKKLILKTVPEPEMNMIRTTLERLQQHFEQNPHSLISKIYGAYTYENTDLGLRFHFILMKNICGFPSKFVDRAYDMKGSRYDREVLKGQQIDSKAQLKGMILKDVDFEKYEQKLYLHSDLRKAFLDQIKRDSEFFRSVNLIDYSFMVFVVNKQEAAKEIDPANDFTAKSQLGSMENINEPGLYYNMGIIDYLQPFNLQKRMERFLKRLKKLDRNLDTSSQHPEYYSDRFIKFIEGLVPAESDGGKSSGEESANTVSERLHII